MFGKALATIGLRRGRRPRVNIFQTREDTKAFKPKLCQSTLNSRQAAGGGGVTAATRDPTFYPCDTRHRITTNHSGCQTNARPRHQWFQAECRESEQAQPTRSPSSPTSSEVQLKREEAILSAPWYKGALSSNHPPPTGIH